MANWGEGEGGKIHTLPEILFFNFFRILVLNCQHAVYCKGSYLSLFLSMFFFSLFIIGPFPGVCVCVFFFSSFFFLLTRHLFNMEPALCPGELVLFGVFFFHSRISSFFSVFSIINLG